MDFRFTHYGGLATIGLLTLAMASAAPAVLTTPTRQGQSFDVLQVEAWDPTAPKVLQDYLRRRSGCGLVTFTGAGHVIVTVLHCPQTIAASRAMTPVTLPILP